MLMTPTVRRRLWPLAKQTASFATNSSSSSNPQAQAAAAAAARAATPTNAKPPSSSALRSLKRLFAAYEQALDRRPVLTKAATSGILYGAGDAIAQAITAANEPQAAPPATPAPADAAAARDEQPFFLDGPRMLRAVAFGGIFYAPLAHIHYEFLERLVVRKWRTSKRLIPFTKMFIEQFVYWSYFSNAYYHVVLGALQGFTPQQCYDRVVETLWDTLKAQWAFWIPAQLINFRMVPVRHQLNFVLVVSLAWTTFLSLAFPPTKPVTAKSDS